MDEQDERRQAAEALATVRAHQDRVRRVTRMPWWVYLAMFLLGVAGSAANDFVDLTGSKLIALVILVVLVVVLVTGIADGSAPLNRVRGVQPRQSFVPSVFGVVVAIGGLGVWLISRYGNGLTHSVADAVGLGNYPNTVAGVIYGAAFTALFALSQLLLRASQRRTTR